MTKMDKDTAKLAVRLDEFLDAIDVGDTKLARFIVKKAVKFANSLQLLGMCKRRTVSGRSLANASVETRSLSIYYSKEKYSFL